MTPLYGRLAQVMGRKGAMILALSLFFSKFALFSLPQSAGWYWLIRILAGTLCCVLAPSMSFILVARGIAGAGSGGLLTVTVGSCPLAVSAADSVNPPTGNHHLRPRLDSRSRTLPRRRERALRCWCRNGCSLRRGSLR
jgi:MFS family permease